MASVAAAAAAGVTAADDQQVFEKILSSTSGKTGEDGLTVVFFWAEFHAPSCTGGQMDMLFSALQKRSSASFLKINVETCNWIHDRFRVTEVPTFLFIRDGNEVGRVEGASTKQLVSTLEQSKTATTPAASMDQRLRKLTTSAPIMLFMKGTPENPRCKFSRQMVQILSEEQVNYGAFDILGDQEVRQALKDFSGWKTYPQIYKAGKLVGGLDTIKALRESEGTLASLSASEVSVPTPQSSAAKSSPTETPEQLRERLKTLISMSQVVLFMKGSPGEPRCGFSRSMVQILQQQNITFQHFDILQDNAVRQGLKTFSDWPTYPQLYVDGELQGGLDVVKEMLEEGDLKEQLGLQ